MKLKVENTETGEVVNVRLVPTVDLFKFEVSLMFPIPPHEQIILYGPPFKVIDSVYLDILKQCYGSSSSGTNSPSINETIRSGNNVNRFGFDNDNNNNNSNNNYQGNNKYNSNNVPNAINTLSPSSNIDSSSSSSSSSSSLLSPIQTKRCFLYNRKILASDDKDLKQIRLLPLKPNPLNLSDIQSPMGLNRSSSGSGNRGYMNSKAMAEWYEYYYKSILQSGVNYEMFIADR
jgi:hypothetical protein